MNNDILHSAPLITGLVAMLAAQFLKPFIKMIWQKQFDWRMMKSTGGMPSSHTAFVIALTTSIALVDGLGSVSFAISLVFALIIIHDAMGVRREAGRQAEVINDWSKQLSKLFEEGQFNEENLKTMLGHSFSQVLGGAILGFLAGFFGTPIVQNW
jgi:uncharacterized protein